MAKVPDPILDTRDGDRLVAEAIESLPDELSDRSDSNPAVVVIEAVGAVCDRVLYQVNQWPRGVLQKMLAVLDIEMLEASSGITTAKFTLSAPEPEDLVIPEGTEIANETGSIVYETTEDLTIPGYTVQTGTITITSGSAAVVGVGTSFDTDWDGTTTYQIQGASGSWYTIATVTDATNLVLSSNATSTQSGVAFQVGAITGTVSAQSVETGLDQGAGAGVLTVMQSSVPGVSSVTNTTKSAGESDEETIAQVLARAPIAFSARDTAVSASDYEAFAQAVLGRNSRAKALLNRNLTADETGSVTVALLSPSWTVSAGATAAERAAVAKDLYTRTDKRIIDTAALIETFIPAAVVWRRKEFDETRCRIAIAEALNTYLSPNTYPFGRAIYADDLGDIINDLPEVDRVFTNVGILCVGVGFTTTAGTIAFTTASNSATCSDAQDGTDMQTALTAGRPPIIMDTTNKAVYTVTAVGGGGTTLTLGANFTGANVTAAFGWFQTDDTGLAATDAADYTLPYCELSTAEDDLPSSIMVVGVAD